MTGLQRDEDDPVIGPDGRAIAEGKIVRACRQSDIIDDDPAFRCGYHFADRVFDRLKDSFCRFDAGSGRDTDMELYLAAVDQRKEIAAYEEEQYRAERKDEDEDDGDNGAPLHEDGQQIDITAPHAFEATLERVMQPSEMAASRFRVVSRSAMLVLQQQPDGNRGQGARNAIGRQHGKDDRLAERGEEKFRRPLQ